MKITNDSWSVGDVARLAGVTVRTLHHYDRIGLLRPGVRSNAGYRGYSRADLARLQRILAYRELGFALEDVGRLLDDPENDPVAQLRHQHRLVLDRMERLAQIAAVLERGAEVGSDAEVIGELARGRREHVERLLRLAEAEQNRPEVRGFVGGEGAGLREPLKPIRRGDVVVAERRGQAVGALVTRGAQRPVIGEEPRRSAR
jgi:DNA-binding transcriptional MerR regulator